MADFELSHQTIIEYSWANESNFRLSSRVVRLCLFALTHFEILTAVSSYSSRMERWLFDRINVLRFDSWFASSRLLPWAEFGVELIILISSRSLRQTSRSVNPARGDFRLIRVRVELCVRPFFELFTRVRGFYFNSRTALNTMRRRIIHTRRLLWFGTWCWRILSFFTLDLTMMAALRQRRFDFDDDGGA